MDGFVVAGKGSYPEVVAGLKGAITQIDDYISELRSGPKTEPYQAAAAYAAEVKAAIREAIETKTQYVEYVLPTLDDITSGHCYMNLRYDDSPNIGGGGSDGGGGASSGGGASTGDSGGSTRYQRIGDWTGQRRSIYKRSWDLCVVFTVAEVAAEYNVRNHPFYAAEAVSKDYTEGYQQPALEGCYDAFAYSGEA